MLRQVMALLLVTGLAGCTVAPTSTVEPEPRGSQGPYGQPRDSSPYDDSGSRQSGYPAPTPTPAPGSSRRTPAVATYSDSSTGVSAADALLREGKAYHQRGQYSNAANTFERALRMAPRSPALYLALAKTRLALNDHNSAIQMANRALSLLPNEGWGVSDARADAWNIIAESRAATGDRQGAEAARTRAREYW